jgi:hypothetical protein
MWIRWIRIRIRIRIRNWFFAGIDSSCVKIFNWYVQYTYKERERAPVLFENSLFQLLKFMFHWHWATLFQLGSYLVSTWFLAPMTAS